jgi:hypothetical protein
MAAKKKAPKKKKTPAEKIQTGRRAHKKSAQKKAAPAKKAAKRAPRPAARMSNASKKRVRARKQMFDPAFSESQRVPALSGDADSQGLSDVERADSESVSELIEEGNVFEAGVVSGVERADDSDEKEVRTREVPEDDVPEEYLDRD